MFTLVPYNSFAVDACVPNDTGGVLLDSSIKPTSYSNGTSTNPWRITYSNGVLVGTSACLTIGSGKQRGYIHKAKDGALIDNGQIVVGGEKNGGFCWCKLTYPVVSNWFLFGGDNVDWCNSWCNHDTCAYWWFINENVVYNGMNAQERRALIFNSIEN